jgi:hypothetical protein
MPRAPKVFALIGTAGLLLAGCSSSHHQDAATASASAATHSAPASAAMSSAVASSAGSTAPTGSTGSAPGASGPSVTPGRPTGSASATKAPAATVAGGAATTRAATTAPAEACGTAASGHHYAHVVWIWMENKPYGSVIGSSSAPYENALARSCGMAGNYSGITHPSLPNYIAATAGSNFGISDDNGPSSHPLAQQSIFGQLAAAGSSWKSYEESMPHNCATSPSGNYAVKHNPAAYFTAIRTSCGVDDVPLSPALANDIAAGALPAFSFVTPNLCDDTHDCSVSTGDKWLATWVPRILAGPNYRAGNTLVVVTWDEGDSGNNHIPTIVVAPSVRPGTVAGAALNHYSLLRTTEDLLGVGHLGGAASASSLAAAFGL